MVSLQSIAREFGLSDDEVADILNLSTVMREIGLGNYFMNTPVETHYREVLAPYRKNDVHVTEQKRYSGLMEPYEWWNYAAPVYPPMSIQEKVRRTGRSVDWQNIFWDGLSAAAIFYRTRPATSGENGDGFITHVLPGSYVVSKIYWLEKISNLDAPSEY